MQPTPSTGEQRSWAKATGFLVALYLVGLALARSELHLDALWNGVRRRS